MSIGKVVKPATFTDGNAFGIVQPPSGTSPTASSTSDALTLTSSDSSVSITGNSATKTIDIKAGTVPIGSGGTGQTTQQAALDAIAGAVTSGQYLRGNGTHVALSAIQAADVPTLNQNTSGTAAGLSATLIETSGGTNQSTYTKGDTLYSSATNTLSKLAIGTTTQLQGVTASGVPGWIDEQDPSTHSVLFDDFDAVGGRYPWGATNSTGGGGAGSTTATDGTFVGSISLTTGTSTAVTSRYMTKANTGGIVLGGGTVRVKIRVRYPLLSAATEEYKGYHGLHDAPTTGSDANGVYFLYDRATNGNFWACVTNKASSKTTTVLDGGGGRATAAVAANTWDVLDARINAAGTQVLFYINNVLVATHSTNIPTANVVDTAAILSRSSYTSTAKTVEVDYYWRNFVPTVAR